MADEKRDINELLGMTSEQLDDQAAEAERLNELVDRVGEADPHVLTSTARSAARQAVEVSLNADSTPNQVRGALDLMCYFVTLLSKRLILDNPQNIIIKPGDLH